MKLQLNDIVTATLTETGAHRLNEYNKELQFMIRSETFKIDYRDGDTYTTVLWELFMILGASCRHGAPSVFTEITKA